MERLQIALHVPHSRIPLTTAPLPPYSRPGPKPAAPPVQGQAELTPVQQLTSDALGADYDAVTVPLTNANWKARWERYCVVAPGSGEEPEAGKRSSLLGALGGVGGQGRELAEEAERWRAGGGFMRGEVTVTRLEETEALIVHASDWLELDSPDEGIRFDSELALKQEVAYASYLNISTLILPAPRNRRHVADYARAVNAALASSNYIQLSMRVPVSDPIELRRSRNRSFSGNSGAPASPAAAGAPLTSVALTPFTGDPSSTWEVWDAVRTLCDYSSRLSLTLDLSQPLPPAAALARWAAEPTRHIILPATAFIPNAKGYPVLSKACQAFLKEEMKHRPTIIVTGTSRGLHPSGGQTAYVQYVRHLEKLAAGHDAASSVEAFAKGYMDWLQAPLQPLMDNLESSTYEVFERDPIKYQKYEQAIYLALCDRPPNSTTTIIVVGAGRGPLVQGALNAIAASAHAARVIAVEKNPNAFVTLQERKALEWGEAVEILFGDMREVIVPDKADILVSELLGSFGDNELSPECLDGVMRLMKPDGISIPSAYTSHLAPLSSSKLYNEVTATQSKDTLKLAETPYVVMFQAVNTLSGDGGGKHGRCGRRVQQCWSFEHPRRDIPVDSRGNPLGNSHNTRAAHLTFHIPHAGALHGLAGYFEAHLYADVWISIHPERYDNKMLSWFPIYFPLREPLYLPSNSELDVHLWRLTDGRKVWYEWCAEAFLPLPPLPSPAPASPLTPNTGTTTLSASVVHGGGGAHGNIPPPSPMVDAAFRVPLPGAPGADDDASAGEGRLKISQTRLHNPRGRSSWIGL